MSEKLCPACGAPLWYVSTDDDEESIVEYWECVDCLSLHEFHYWVQVEDYDLGPLGETGPSDPDMGEPCDDIPF